MNRKVNLLSIMMEEKNKYEGRIGKIKKSFSFDKKDININEESRTISGYGAVYGNLDKAGDVLVKGCCAKSIQERGPESSTNDKIIFLWMHDMKNPVGKITVLKEDDRGLYFEAEIDRIPEGDRLIVQLNSGTINQFSIGYSYDFDKCHWDSKGAFVVEGIELYEISAVSIGANGQTEFIGMKSDEGPEKFYEKLFEMISNATEGLEFEKKQQVEIAIAYALALNFHKIKSQIIKDKKPEPLANESPKKISLINIKTK